MANGYDATKWEAKREAVAAQLITMAKSDAALADRLIRKGAERLPQEKANSAELKAKAISEDWDASQFLTEGREDGARFDELVMDALLGKRIAKADALAFTKLKTIASKREWCEAKELID